MLGVLYEYPYLTVPFKAWESVIPILQQRKQMQRPAQTQAAIAIWITVKMSLKASSALQGDINGQDKLGNSRGRSVGPKMRGV